MCVCVCVCACVCVCVCVCVGVRVRVCVPASVSLFLSLEPVFYPAGRSYLSYSFFFFASARMEDAACGGARLSTHILNAPQTS